MNLICPSCGQAGNETTFRRIGQKKLLCMNCKAVLQIALKCPACDGIMAMPFISPPQVVKLRLFGLWKRSHGLNGHIINCPCCHYSAQIDQFDRVAVFNEEYSIII